MAVTTDRDRERVNLVTIAYFSHCVLANKVQPWLSGCGAEFEPAVSHDMSPPAPTQRYFRDIICQPLATSYVIDAYLCLAMLHTRTLDT